LTNSPTVLNISKLVLFLCLVALSRLVSAAGVGECTVIDNGDPPGPDSAAVLFETNFSLDSGYRATGFPLWNDQGRVQPPTGWDGVYAPTGSVIEVVPGQGVNGSNALKLSWPGASSQPVLRLGKHLTGNINTGYDEVYIRYHVKLPDDFKVGSGGNIGHWKWGRLWQNASPTPVSGPGQWTENREDAGYIVWNIAGNPPYTDVNVTFSENVAPPGGNIIGSSGGARQKADYFVSGANTQTTDGYFESMAGGAWAFDYSSGYLLDRSQEYHTLEFRFKLASTQTSNDGVFEMWWDGVKQSKWTRLQPGGNAPTRSGIPTANRGSGLNFVVLFDNLVGWNSDWGQSGVDGYILVNDVVISRSRIGHNYVVNSGGS